MNGNSSRELKKMRRKRLISKVLTIGLISTLSVLTLFSVARNLLNSSTNPDKNNSTPTELTNQNVGEAGVVERLNDTSLPSLSRAQKDAAFAEYMGEMRAIADAKYLADAKHIEEGLTDDELRHVYIIDGYLYDDINSSVRALVEWADHGNNDKVVDLIGKHMVEGDGLSPQERYIREHGLTGKHRATDRNVYVNAYNAEQAEDAFFEQTYQDVIEGRSEYSSRVKRQIISLGEEWKEATDNLWMAGTGLRYNRDKVYRKAQAEEDVEARFQKLNLN